MKFFPKNKKFNKVFKYRINNGKYYNHRTIKLCFGNIGIKALSPGILTLKHFNSLNLIIKKTLKRRGSFIFRKYPYTFLTKKPSEVRMGKGKGNFDTWICPIQAGEILLEFNFFNSISKIEILFLLRKCIQRLPMETRIFSYNCKLIKKDRNYATSLNL